MEFPWSVPLVSLQFLVSYIPLTARHSSSLPAHHPRHPAHSFQRSSGPAIPQLFLATVCTVIAKLGTQFALYLVQLSCVLPTLHGSEKLSCFTSFVRAHFLLFNTSVFVLVTVLSWAHPSLFSCPCAENVTLTICFSQRHLLSGNQNCH